RHPCWHMACRIGTVQQIGVLTDRKVTRCGVEAAGGIPGSPHADCELDRFCPFDRGPAGQILIDTFRSSCFLATETKWQWRLPSTRPPILEEIRSPLQQSEGRYPYLADTSVTSCSAGPSPSTLRAMAEFTGQVLWNRSSSSTPGEA